MDWEERTAHYIKVLKSNLISARDFLDACFSPSYIAICLFVLLLAQTCSTTEVRIILENNGSPIVIRKVITNKIVQTAPVKTITSTKKKKAVVNSDTKFQVDDCMASSNYAEKMSQNAELEDWEKSALHVEKVIKVGRVKYQYVSWYEDHWLDVKFDYEIDSIDRIKEKVDCPSA